MDSAQYKKFCSEFAEIGFPTRDSVVFVGLCSVLTISGICLSIDMTGVGERHWFVWLLGQALLSIAMVQWFVILHEAGHGTLTKSSALNSILGHLGSFFVCIPYRSWKGIHYKHHVWTGWRDLDPTTKSLCNKEISGFSKTVMSGCWIFYIPIFSVIYRSGTYWNFSHLAENLRKDLNAALVNSVILGLIYGGLALWFGGLMLQVFGLAFFVHLVIFDPILISQHSHIPQERSKGVSVRKFSYLDQEKFTRSLKFPDFFSKWVLMRFDMHELHHVFPTEASLNLGNIDYEPENQVVWSKWLRDSKSIPAETLILKDRKQSGFSV